MATILQEIDAFTGAVDAGRVHTILLDSDLLLRLRKFLWVSSGMFSMSCFALAFTGYAAVGAVESAGANFVAAVVSGGLFGLASILKFGPDSD